MKKYVPYIRHDGGLHQGFHGIQPTGGTTSVGKGCVLVAAIPGQRHGASCHGSGGDGIQHGKV